MGGRQEHGKWGVDSTTALKQAPRPPLKKPSKKKRQKYSYFSHSLTFKT